MTICKRVFACGLNESGQLGIGPDDRVIRKTYEPKAVLLSQEHFPAQIACGLLHSVILTRAGTVFCFGDNTYGQLGIGKTIANGTSVPQ